jgi:hypothetical protein
MDEIYLAGIALCMKISIYEPARNMGYALERMVDQRPVLLHLGRVRDRARLDRRLRVLRRRRQLLTTMRARLGAVALRVRHRRLRVRWLWDRRVRRRLGRVVPAAAAAAAARELRGRVRGRRTAGVSAGVAHKCERWDQLLGRWDKASDGADRRGLRRL